MPKLESAIKLFRLASISDCSSNSTARIFSVYASQLTQNIPIYSLSDLDILYFDICKTYPQVR